VLFHIDALSFRLYVHDGEMVVVKAREGGHEPRSNDRNRLGVATGSKNAAGGSEEPHPALPTRIDHLGIPFRVTKKQKFKYSRTFTIMYDSQKEQSLIDEKLYRVLQDARKLMDSSLSGLRQLHNLFLESVPNVEQSLLGQSAFRLVLIKHGVRDAIIMQRLFDEFSILDTLGTERIDFRLFLRMLCSVNQEPLEEKLALLFEVWDVDQGGSLSYSELQPIIVDGVRTHELQMVNDHFNRVWTEIRTSLVDTDREVWIGASQASGVTKDDLVIAIQRLPSARFLFDKILTRRAPMKEEKRSSFQSRLKELQAALHEENRAKVKQQQQQQQQQSEGETEDSRSASSPPAHAHGMTAVVEGRRGSIRGLRRSSSMIQPGLLGASQGKLYAYKKKAEGTLNRQIVVPQRQQSHRTLPRANSVASLPVAAAIKRVGSEKVRLPPV
jgi:hypothetical protein